MERQDPPELQGRSVIRQLLFDVLTRMVLVAVLSALVATVYDLGPAAAVQRLKNNVATLGDLFRSPSNPVLQLGP